MERESEGNGNWQGHRYFLNAPSFSVTAIFWTIKGEGKYSIWKKERLHLWHVVSLWFSFLICKMGSISGKITSFLSFLIPFSQLAFPSTYLYFVIFPSLFILPSTWNLIFFSSSGEDKATESPWGQERGWAVGGAFPGIWDSKPLFCHYLSSTHI